MDHGAPHQVSWLLLVLALGIVEDRAAHTANMVEKRLPSDSAVIGMRLTRPGVRSELLGEPIPRRPGRRVLIDEHHGVGGLDRRHVRARAERVEPIHADQARLEGKRFQVGGVDPTDGEVEDTLGDPGGLGVRRHHPGVDPQLRDSCGPLGPVDGAPIDASDPDRFGRR
jgi:hypothetical protein